MAENSTIEWTDHTFNPWEGCQKVGPGCDHCYAETRNARFGGGTAPNWGPGAPRRRTSEANWRKPLAWQKDAARFFARHGRRQRVFCASLADVFDNAVDFGWQCELAELICATPDLDWLLLTKRIGNAGDMLWHMFNTEIPANVRPGATIVSQAEWDRDCEKIANVFRLIRRPLFLSVEPMLGSLDLYARDPFWNLYIGWVICGGESGPGARPMHPDWARSLRDQCGAMGVPFLFKQWGEWADLDAAGITLDADKVTFRNVGDALLYRVGKKSAGRLLDGIQHDGVPA